MVKKYICKTCGADTLSPGNLMTCLPIGAIDDCINCFHTKKDGRVLITSENKRTDAQVNKTKAILETEVKKPVISYKLDIDLKDGCVYNQRIRIPWLTFAKLKYFVDREIERGFPTKAEYVNTAGYEFYLVPLERSGNICFLNHTQRRFINLYLNLKLDYKHNSYFKIDGI